jgi:hypothetical protein
MPRQSTRDEEWLATQCTLICAKAAAAPLHDRKSTITREIRALNCSDTLKIALETMVLTMENTVVEASGNRDKYFGFGFGVVFIVAILVLAIQFPNPTPFQYLVFRVVLSLAAAGIGGVLSGFLTVVFSHAKKPWLQAGGALAVFIVVYMLNPAKLVVQ